MKMADMVEGKYYLIKPRYFPFNTKFYGEYTRNGTRVMCDVIAQNETYGFVGMCMTQYALMPFIDFAPIKAYEIDTLDPIRIMDNAEELHTFINQLEQLIRGE